MRACNPIGRATALALSSVLCGFASAAEEASLLEEIIVTATKRTQSLQDVPVAVSAVTAEDIRARGYTDYSDFLNALPGVYFTDAGPGSSGVQIRGLAASEGGVASTVATYFGETVTSVLTNFGGKPNLRLVDVERVEVLRGPQGTLFGANSLAGVVRIIPAAPDLQEFSLDLATRAYATAHSDDASYHFEAAANIPLLEDKLALRLVGYQHEIAGYIDNEFPGQPAVDYSATFGLPEGTLVTPAIEAFTRRDINDEETTGGRAALRWQATDRLRFDLMLATQEVDVKSEPFVLPDGGDYGQPRGLDRYEQGGQGERLDIHSLTISYDWDNASLISATNRVQMQRHNLQDITFLAEGAFGAPIPWSLRDRSWGELFTQELRVQSSGDGPFQWMLGGFYLEQDADATQFVPDYSCPTCLPTVLFGEDFALDFPRVKFSDQEQRSIFGEVSYRVAPRWVVGAGVRYLEEELKSLDGPSRGLLVGGLLPPQPTRAGKVDEVNPSAYVRFEPSGDTSFYVQAARGFRSGNVNQSLPEECRAQADALGIGTLTEPDTLWNYELGVKSVLEGGRLSIHSAIYKHQWEGVQLSTLLDCGFGQGFNGGNVEGEGVELELQARISNAWRVNLSAAYNHNEFERIRSTGVAFSVGEHLPNAPQKNGSAGVQYDFVLGGQWSGFARIDYVYLGDIRFKYGQDELGRDVIVNQPSFETTDVRLAFQRDALSIELFGENVADERAAITSASPNVGSRIYLIRPREVGIELRYRFD